MEGVQMAMIALLTVAVILLISCKILHFTQHFRLQSCWMSSVSINMNRTPSTSTSSTKISTITHHKQRPCRCICVAIDDEEYDFFPMAFLLYLVSLIIISVIITIRLILINFSDNFDFTGLKHRNMNHSQTHSIHISQYSGSTQLICLYIDWILIYGVMFLSLFESLLSFYRYYTTLVTTKYLRLLTTMDILKKFSYFAVLFIIFYILTIHCYFYLFPLVIILYIAFNLFCNLKFSALLISSYSNFISIETIGKHSLNTSNKDILNSVYFMKRASLICTIIQSIYLCIFIIVYNINVIFYLPILWSISSAIFTLNFIRNRQTLTQCYVRCRIQSKKIDKTAEQNDNYQLNIIPSFIEKSPAHNKSETNTKKVSFNVDKITAGTHAHNINGTRSVPQTPLSPIHLSNTTQKKSKSMSMMNTPTKILNSIRNAVEFPFDPRKSVDMESHSEPFYIHHKTQSNPIYNSECDLKLQNVYSAPDGKTQEAIEKISFQSVNLKNNLSNDIGHGHEFSDEYIQNNSDFEMSIQTEIGDIAKDFEKYISASNLPNINALNMPHFVSTQQARSNTVVVDSDVENKSKNFDPNYVVEKLNVYLRLFKSLGICSGKIINDSNHLQVHIYHNNPRVSRSILNEIQANPDFFVQ
eukprot:231868_1